MIEQFTRYLSQNLHKVAPSPMAHTPRDLFLFLAKEVHLGHGHLRPSDEQSFLNWYKNLFHLSFLRELIQEEGAQEIIIHSPQNIHLYGHFSQKRTLSMPNITQEQIDVALELLAFRKKKNFNFQSPLASIDGPLFGKSLRITLGHRSTLVSKHHKAYIRIFGAQNLELEHFCHGLGPEVLLQSVQEKKNVLIAGGTSSGKTALLRKLLEDVPPEEHLVIIEDVQEIFLPPSHGHTHLIKREGQEHDLLSFSTNVLRMRPDRIIMGEVRSREVAPLLLNLNTGHRGLITTIHANSALKAIDRLATLFHIFGPSATLNSRAIYKMVCENIDLVIFLRQGQIQEVISLKGARDERPNYDWIYKAH